MKHLYTFILLAFGIGTANSQCTPPVITAALDPDPICSGNPATLTATSNAGTIHWYNSMSNATELGSGSPFQTNNLTQTTSFFVEAHNGEIIAPAVSGGGKVAPSGTAGSTVNNATTPWGLVFNATQKFILNSVDVFLSSATPGNVIIELKDANFAVLQSATVSVPAGGTGASPLQYTVPLGFTIEPASGYRLVVASGPAMIRDLGSNNFPFAIGAVGTITQGTINNGNANSGVYYFLYNWNFSPVSVCKSVREQVVVTVNPVPAAPAGNSMQSFTGGQTLADLDVTGQNLVWYSDVAGTNAIPNTTLLTDGATYFVNQTVEGCTGPMLTIMVDDPLSTETHQFEKLVYYPNPTSGNLTITCPTVFDHVSVLNMHGQLILSKDCNANWTTIDLTNLAAGNYIVKITSGLGIKNLKLCKI